ncbi:MAG: M20/M25/M40 family metallo-hydrolase [Planctomycetes bacterium]|nr:M20/M25/M40 family metallo-hydrolase [Planctomycetota bacterium]
MNRFPKLFVALFFASMLASLPARAAEDSAATIEKRISGAANYLASDELEGRGVDTKGINQAAEYIADQFRQLGLKTELYQGQPFQSFTITTSSKLGPADHNVLTLHGPKEGSNGQGKQAPPSALKLEKDFTPLTAGGSAKFDLPLVFVGYGITAPDAHYDDYAGLDVKGKAVVVIRHQPQQANPHSPLGASPSRHAVFDRKIANAYEHGAAAVIFCTSGDQLTDQRQQIERRWQAAVDALAEARTAYKKIAKPTAEETTKYKEEVGRQAAIIQQNAASLASAADPVLGTHAAGEGVGREIPVLHCRREVIDPVLKSVTGRGLVETEAAIDQDFKPQSAVLKGWTAQGQTDIVRQEVQARNIVAVLEGEGPHADETIVIGAHYDHIGRGGVASAAPGSHEIHNGADDNASGTVALIEIARRLTALDKKLPRRIVLIAFSGEERGLLGSAHYIKHPLFPLDKTVAMLNLDMVGRLKDNKLIASGLGTATEFEPLVRRINAQHNFEIIKKPEGFGPSDHASFYAAKIPVIHFFTGAHGDYHRPSDDADKLNIPGIRRISSLVAETAIGLAEAPGRPTYQETKGSQLGSGGSRPYFGSIPDYSEEGPGLRLQGITPDGPAARGGLKAGDVIIHLGESRIGTIVDFDSALRKHKAGDKVKVVVKRGATEKTLEVTLDPPK